MKKKVVFFGLVFITILIAGCIQQLTRNEIQFIKMGKQLGCVGTSDFPSDKDREFIINSNQEYQTLIGYKVRIQECEDFKLPQIDFSQYTLLGKYTQGGGCSVDFVSKVYKDDSKKKISYSIKIDEEGYCEKLVESMNWVLIPKVPFDYSVEFEIE